jgi:hypothetical protein
MMLILVLVGVALLLFPLVADGASIRRPPEEWAKVVAACLIAGAVTIEAGLLLTGLPTVLHLPLVEEFTGACHSVVDRLAVSPVVGWTCFALGALTLSFMIRTVVRARRLGSQAWIEPWIGTHRTYEDYELVILPSSELLAVSVSRPSPQVVVTQGIAERLSTTELEVVIEHEATHLRLGHRRFLVIASMVDQSFRWLPAIRRSAEILRCTVEEWADEQTVRNEQTRRHQLRCALRTVASASPRPRDAHPVRRRLERLATQVRFASGPERLVAYSPAVSLTAFALIVLLGWLGASNDLLSLGGYCPA